MTKTPRYGTSEALRRRETRLVLASCEQTQQMWRVIPRLQREACSADAFLRREQQSLWDAPVPCHAAWQPECDAWSLRLRGGGAAVAGSCVVASMPDG